MSFRLSADDLARLDSVVREHGTSRGEAARRIVVEHLEKPTDCHSTARLDHVSEQLAELREDVRVAVTALLVHAAHIPISDAEAWVTENLS